MRIGHGAAREPRAPRAPGRLWRRVLVGGAGALLLGAVLGATLWCRAALLLPADPGTTTAVLVDVQPGLGVRAIALLLQQRGVIRSAWAFDLLARHAGLTRALQAGTYALQPAMTPVAVLRVLASGETATVRVTIPEGYSGRQVIAALTASGLGDAQGLAAGLQDASLLAAAGLPAPGPGAQTALEGFLYPATYAFAPDEAAPALLARMLRQFSLVWTPALAAEASANAGLDTLQAVTLASIVQREVAQPAQMPLVAAVYLHRLRSGMDLDADPTVLYALGVQGQQGPLTATEQAVSSPYNTYRVAGLPPGPICNPGSAALQAVAQPARTTALYFLTAPDGSLVLADTLAEQEANLQTYLGG